MSNVIILEIEDSVVGILPVPVSLFLRPLMEK
jgi:hypothetical protein